MEWSRLLNKNRLGKQPVESQGGSSRSEFQRDFDRIVFSTAFRRLQSKTQVFPLPQTDFIHTRLTHSLEASCVGRSLGRIAAQEMLRKEPDLFRSIQTGDEEIAAIVSAACLAHDIGNPPFGHSGEDAISEYFRRDASNGFLEGLTDPQKADLQNFEGNANGFRLLTHTLPAQSTLQGGLQLTFATLGAFIKYPKPSLPKFTKDPKASEKKFSYFQSEKYLFEQVADALDLAILADSGEMRKRHPLAFLVEAADDICYIIMDLEDGYKLRLISYPEVTDLLMPLIDPVFLDQNKLKAILDKREKLGYLRAIAINSLIHQAADCFSENMCGLLNGSFDRPLTACIPNGDGLEEIRAISEKRIYSYRKATEIEAAGFEVISGLLDAFLNAILGPDTKWNKKIHELIPPQYIPDDSHSDYERIMTIVQFVAEMTDTFAINTFRTIKGISLPTY